MRPVPSDTPSTVSEGGSADASSSSTAYNASLKPLTARPPNRQLLDGADMLPTEAIMEQFDRAQQYVLKNKGEFTAEQQDKLQVRLCMQGICFRSISSGTQKHGLCLCAPYARIAFKAGRSFCDVSSSLSVLQADEFIIRLASGLDGCCASL